MSLAIDVDNVTAVLLADGWHQVKDASLDLDSYEFKYQGEVIFRGAQSKRTDSTGFVFQEATQGTPWICGPLTSILAMRLQSREAVRAAEEPEKKQ